MQRLHTTPSYDPPTQTHTHTPPLYHSNEYLLKDIAKLSALNRTLANSIHVCIRTEIVKLLSTIIKYVHKHTRRVRTFKHQSYYSIGIAQNKNMENQLIRTSDKSGKCARKIDKQKSF